MASKPPQQHNGIKKSQDVIVIDSDDEEEEPQQSHLAEDYESEEDQHDPDSPSPSIVQAVELDIGSAVLQIAVPALATTTAIQGIQLATTHAVVALACANGKVLLLTIPLAPPKVSSVADYVSKGIGELELAANDSLTSDISIKLIPNDDAHSASSRARKSSELNKNAQARLLVAVSTTRLQLWSIGLTATSLSTAKRLASPILRLPASGSKVSYHPSSKLSQLLCVDPTGAVRIYEPFADTKSALSPNEQTLGKWVTSYLTPFRNQTGLSALARRKVILGAEWVLGGRGILALLEDGEWGIWDLSGKAQPGKTAEEFALNGYLVSTSTTETRDASRPKHALSKLAPMTPNTRKSKAENLFTGPVRAAGVAPTGGISISQSIDRGGSLDESVIMWYNGAIYSIPSLQTFWQRSNNSKSGGLGSLYAPALTHISDIDLMNENITSVSQFAASSTSTSSGLGQMNLPRDLLVSAEHRFMIVQNLRNGVQGASTLFQQQVVERPAPRDQRMLDAGELDIGAMDRMLDNIASGTETRRVGFAA